MKKILVLMFVSCLIGALSSWWTFGNRQSLNVKENIIGEDNFHIEKQYNDKEDNSTIEIQCNDKADNSNIEKQCDDKEDNDVLEYEVENSLPIFSVSKINGSIEKRINGISWTEDAPVGLIDLRYLEVSYWGFDDISHVGEIIVNECIAEEVLDIFKELYDNDFKIEKMNLISDYEANDNLSMADNNSSGFCFRAVEGTTILSKHSYGIAIDINPIQNPYVKGDKISPAEGNDYIDRSNIREGMIVKENCCYNAFISRGWIWGGEWNSLKDYQHFQKDFDAKD